MESSLHHIQPTCCCQVLLACISRGARQSALLARTPIATTTHHTNILPQAELHHKHKSTINTSSHPLANCSFPTPTSPSIQPHGRATCTMEMHASPPWQKDVGCVWWERLKCHNNMTWKEALQQQTLKIITSRKTINNPPSKHMGTINNFLSKGILLKQNNSSNNANNHHNTWWTALRHRVPYKSRFWTMLQADPSTINPLSQEGLTCLFQSPRKKCFIGSSAAAASPKKSWLKPGKCKASYRLQASPRCQKELVRVRPAFCCSYWLRLACSLFEIVAAIGLSCFAAIG